MHAHHTTWQVARLDETLDPVVVDECDTLEEANSVANVKNGQLNEGVVDTQIVYVVIPPTGTFEIV